MPEAKLVLEISNLNKSYDLANKKLQVLADINFTVQAGEFVAIVGRSGCGKSTLLKIIAGLVDYDSGEAKENGEKIEGPDIDRGMVFQEHRLLPWMTIENNVGLGLNRMKQEVKKQVVAEAINLVKLAGFEKVYPEQLSGGMAQRAAIARGIATKPKILLLDEPFGALDALTRIQMQKEILRIWQAEKNTMILVTHDIDEAIFLGQRVVVMSERPGKIVSIINTDTPGSKIRASTEFNFLKKQIYSFFFDEDEPEPLEYTI